MILHWLKNPKQEIIFSVFLSSYRERHMVDTPYRKTIISRVDSPSEDLMEIHDFQL